MHKRIRVFGHRVWLSWQEQSAIRFGDGAAASAVEQQIRVEEEIRTVRTVRAKGRL